MYLYALQNFRRRIYSAIINHTNLNALVEMGYLRMEKVRFESKENLELYVLTPAGLEEWNKIKLVRYACL